MTEHFVYAQDTPDNRVHNLAGVCIPHYDQAGIKRRKIISLTGVVLSVTQQLLKNDEEANWQNENAERALDETLDQTITTADTMGGDSHQNLGQGQ